MTNAKKKDELLQEKDKNILKSWKTYAIAAGVIVIGTGIGVGVYYGVNANNTYAQGITEQDISNAIAKTNYTLTKTADTTASMIEAEINADFIRTQLNSDAKTAFKASLFHRQGKITINGRDLANEDLGTHGTLNAKIKYTYGETQPQEVNLQIVLTISSWEMTQELAKTNYNLDPIAVETSAAEVQAMISKDFFKQQLSEEFQNAFNDLVFTFDQIMYDNRELTDADLTEVISLDTTVHFIYGLFDGNISLRIDIVSPTASDIRQKIIDTKHKITTASGSTVAELNAQIPDIIRTNLSELYQKVFKIDKFNSTSISKKINGDLVPINNDDLKEPGVKQFWVKFSYDNTPLADTEIEITLT